MIKVFAWQIIHKNSLKREIKRLEKAIAGIGAEMKALSKAAKNLPKTPKDILKALTKLLTT